MEPNPETARRRSLSRARARVESGEAFWVWRFRAWLGPKMREHGEELLAEWAGIHPRSLRAYMRPGRLTVPVDLVDRLLLWEGSTRLDDLYPLDGEEAEGATIPSVPTQPEEAHDVPASSPDLHEQGAQRGQEAPRDGRRDPRP